MLLSLRLLPLLLTALTFSRATPVLEKNDVEPENNGSHVELHIYAPVKTGAQALISTHWGEHTDLVVQDGTKFDDPGTTDPQSGEDFEMIGNLRFDTSSTEGREFHVFFSTAVNEVKGGADCTATFTGSISTDPAVEVTGYAGVLIWMNDPNPKPITGPKSPDDFTVKCNWDGTGSPKDILTV